MLSEKNYSLSMIKVEIFLLLYMIMLLKGVLVLQEQSKVLKNFLMDLKMFDFRL